MYSKKEKKIIEYNQNNVYQYFGFYPKHVVDLKALSGDKSDNISGIKGISLKCANLLLTIFQDLDNIYANIYSVAQKLDQYLLDNNLKYRLNTLRIQNLLLYNKELAYKCRKLAKIITSLPINLDLKQINFNSKNANLFFQQYSFKSLQTK